MKLSIDARDMSVICGTTAGWHGSLQLRLALGEALSEAPEFRGDFQVESSPPDLSIRAILYALDGSTSRALF